MSVVHLRKRASPSDYVPVGSGYYALPWAIRFCPGALTTDPEMGAREYNEYQDIPVNTPTDEASIKQTIQVAYQFCFSDKNVREKHLLRRVLQNALDPVRYPLEANTSNQATEHGKAFETLLASVFVHKSSVALCLSDAEKSALLTSNLTSV